MTVQGERLTLTIEQAAKALCIGRGTAYEAARRGQLPTIRLGRRLLVPRAALERLLEATGCPETGAKAEQQPLEGRAP